MLGDLARLKVEDAIFDSDAKRVAGTGDVNAHGEVGDGSCSFGKKF